MPLVATVSNTTNDTNWISVVDALDVRENLATNTGAISLITDSGTAGMWEFIIYGEVITAGDAVVVALTVIYDGFAATNKTVQTVGMSMDTPNATDVLVTPAYIRANQNVQFAVTFVGSPGVGRASYAIAARKVTG